MPLWQWSTTPASNSNAATNIDWTYGMPPSDVSPSARQMMADVATWFQGGPEWLNYGNTPTYISSTSFSVPTNQTSIFTVGRRVRTFNTGGTFYGTISASVYTSVTTVTVTMDGTGALDNGLSEVDVGILNPANPSQPQNLPGTFSTLTVNEPSANNTVAFVVNAPYTNGANVKLVGNGTSTPSKTLRAQLGLFQIVNDAYNNTPMSMDDAGDVTFIGNITAYSDERLKKDWSPLPDDFVERLAAVKAGTYSRTDIERRQVGVSAQSLQELMPEAIEQTHDGFLAVAYGQAALAACVELAREVRRLRAVQDALK